MPNRLRVGTRLLLGFCLILTLTTMVSAYAILGLESSNGRSILLLVLGGVVLLSSFIAWYLTRGIVKPLSDALVVAEAISVGNLNVDVEITSKDEIGQLLGGMQQMVVKLRGVIASVKIAADDVATGSHQLSGASEALSEGAEKLLCQIQRIVTAMNEISRAIADVALNAANSVVASEKVLETAMSGRLAVDTTAKDMETIALAIQNAAGTIDELGKHSTQIGQIVGVINDIAGQTNLLALNAAIEAARAGDQGRGFAVVADEVRSLSERTAQSTKSVAEKVLSIQQSAAGSVKAIQQGSQEVKKGVGLAKEARQSLDVIVDTSGEAEEMVHRIAAATDQQSAAVDEVTGNLSSISDITKASVASAQQIKHASAELAKSAADLRGLISFFKGTTAEAEVLVKKAIAHMEKYGRQKALADISNKHGDFVNRDLFVFVYDMQGKCLAHGRNAEKIGENMINFQGPDGSYHVRERIEIAKSKGKGWQQFKSLNPITKKVEGKIAYIEVCDDMIVSSGAYR